MKIFTKILTVVLTVLGFSACSPKVEYGQPIADFRLRATVVDRTTKDPVRDILAKVVLNRDYYNSPLLFQTDNDGFFYTDIKIDPLDQKIKVIWQDIDGVDNGTYAKDSLEFEIKREDFKGGDNRWNYGTQTKEMTIEIDKEQ